MKIVEQSNSRLVYQGGKASMRLFMIAWLGFPLTVMAVLACLAGTATLKCDRVEPALIACQREQTQAFGLLPRQPQPLGEFARATIVTETRTDDEGDKYTVQVLHGIQPNGASKPLGLRQDVSAVTSQINQFIDTPTSPTLTITQDYRLHFLPRIAIPFLFLLCSCQFFAASDIFQVFQLEIDKSQQRLRGKVIYKKRSPKIIKEFSIDDITGIELVEEKDDDDDSIYIAMLHTQQTGSSELYRSRQRQSVVDITETLQQFLSLPVQSNHAPSATEIEIENQPVNQANSVNQADPAKQLAELAPALADDDSPHGQLIYRTEAGVSYCTYNCNHLSNTQRLALDKLAAELEPLGFERMGSLTTTRFAGIIVHAYRHLIQPINAVILQTDSLTVMDLYSAFADGASLTTSTMPGTGDVPSAKIFRNSYPMQTSASELLSYHRQRFMQLNSDHQGQKPASATLKQLAYSIEDYCQRQPSGFLSVSKTYLRQLWIALFNRKALTSST